MQNVQLYKKSPHFTLLILYSFWYSIYVQLCTPLIHKVYKHESISYQSGLTSRCE